MPKATRGTVVTAESRSARKDWIDRNPLRAWRLAHDPKISILEAAERVGVGMSMIQMYERGVHKPGASKDDTLTKLLGADWSSRWDKWLASKPSD